MRSASTPIEPPPAALVSMVSARKAFMGTVGRPAAGVGTIEAARAYLDRNPPPSCGTKSCHDQCFGRAAWLLQHYGLDHRTALELLTDWARGSRHGWTEAQLEHKVEDASRARKNGGAK
jgi:hypothetical protein